MSQYTRFLSLLDDQDYLRSGIIIKDLLSASKYGHYAYFDGFLSWIEKNTDLNPEEKKIEIDKFEKRLLRQSLTPTLFNLSGDNLAKIEARLKKIKQSNLDEIKTGNEKAKNKLKTDNGEVLKYLEDKLLEIEKVENKDEFDAFLIDVKNAENHLISTKFDEDEELRYDRLIDAYASKITSLTNYFANIDLREYNLKALNDFKFVLDSFKKNHRKYGKKNEMLVMLVQEHLFNYDINKLYKETNEFYTYTYNYIFNRLDTENKYIFAESALKTKKI